MNRFSLPVERITWNRRAEWTNRNGRTAAMTYFIECPVCAPPACKAVRCYGVAGERLQWIRLRRLDSCQCVLTPVQDAMCIQAAKRELLEPDVEGTPV